MQTPVKPKRPSNDYDFHNDEERINQVNSQKINASHPRRIIEKLNKSHGNCMKDSR